MAQSYIYARTSTSHQDNENQLAHLRHLYPQATVVEETASGGKSRPELKKLVDRLERGDILVVAALDRLGRRTVEILGLIESLEQRGVILKSLREGVDYSTIAGRLVTQILVSVAELEKSLISERTKLALAAKKKIGIVGGRRPKFTAEQIREVRKMRSCGVTLKKIAEATGISLARVHQLTKEGGGDGKETAK